MGKFKIVKALFDIFDTSFLSPIHWKIYFEITGRLILLYIILALYL